ncbi:MAG: peptidoglycan DD-metalloendopeptidase family protein, partial [Clostridia bacterium]|nr:peptidoglycan DD-metalloendopeptidase family protein [Clostridia bacterium]
EKNPGQDTNTENEKQEQGNDNTTQGEGQNSEQNNEQESTQKEIDMGKVFYIGDSWMVQMSNLGIINKDYTLAKGGAGTTDAYFRNNLKSAMKEDASAIVVMLGLNGVNINGMKDYLNLLSSTYPDKPIYALRVFYVGAGYQSGKITATDYNAKIDAYNQELAQYCGTLGNVTYVDATEGLLTGNVLNQTYIAKGDTFHLNSEGYKLLYGNIKEGIKAGGGNLAFGSVTAESRRLTYIPKDQFDAKMAAYEASGDREVFKYFTLDEEENAVVASWTKTTGRFTTDYGGRTTASVQSGYDSRYGELSGGQASFTEYVATTTAINYKSMVSAYTLPFEYIWALLVMGEDNDFVGDLARMAYNSEIDIGIYDSVTITKNIDTRNYTVEVETVVDGGSPSYSYSEHTDTSVIVTEQNMLQYDIAYADVWIVEVGVKYNYSHSEEKYSNSISITDEDWGPTTTTTHTYTRQDGTEKTTTTSTRSRIINQVNNSTQHIYHNKYERTEPVVRGKVDIDENTSDNFVKAIRRSKNAFRLLTTSNTTKDWLCDILRENVDTTNMVDLTRALLIKAVDPDAEIDFDFSIFKPGSFSDMSVMSSATIGWAWLVSFENSALLAYKEGRTTDYRSSRYIYECITEDKKQYIMHDDLGTGFRNRNYGFGVCFYVGRQGKFQNQGYFAERGIDITAPQYQTYGVSKIDVEIVDEISIQMWREWKELARKKAQNVGVELKEYQIDAIVNIMYQYGPNRSYINSFLAAYKKSGLNETALKNSYPGTKDRKDKIVHLFITGEYITSDGRVLSPADYGGGDGSGVGGYMSALLCNPGVARKTSLYGNDPYHVQQLKHVHRGLDIAVPQGTPIVALGSGTVVESRFQGRNKTGKKGDNGEGRGYYIRIDHGNGYCTLYQHCLKLLVPVGTKVTKGQKIALSGDTGGSSGPHLHLEVWVPHGQGDPNWKNIPNWDVVNPETFDYSKLPQ